MQWAAVVFDLDGVLVDSSPGIETCMNDALLQHGQDPLPPGTVGRYIGPRLRHSFGAILRERGADPSLVDPCMAAFHSRYRDECVPGTTVQPHVDSVVHAAARHTPLAVATSKPTDFAHAILNHFDLSACFVTVEGAPMDHDGEAKEFTLQRALDGISQILESPPSSRECAIVGDRSHDIDAGRALGLATIGVTWGFGSETELHEADHLVRTPAELAALLGAQPAATTG